VQTDEGVNQPHLARGTPPDPALAQLADLGTTLAVTAERGFSRALSGSCHTPIAGYATFRDGELWLRGLLAVRDGSEVMRGERSLALDSHSGDVAKADELGRALADEFKSRGAARLLAAEEGPSNPADYTV